MSQGCISFASACDNGTYRIIIKSHCKNACVAINGAGALIFDLIFHQHPFLMHASSVGSGETVHMHSLARAFSARPSDCSEIKTDDSCINIVLH